MAVEAAPAKDCHLAYSEVSCFFFQSCSYLSLVPWTHELQCFSLNVLKLFLHPCRFHRFSSQPLSSSIPGGCSFLCLASRCPPIFHILYFHILLAGRVHFFSYMLSTKFYASRSDSFHFLSVWKMQSPFLLECFSSVPLFPSGTPIMEKA